MEISRDEYTEALIRMVERYSREIVEAEPVRRALLQHFGLVRIEEDIWNMREARWQIEDDIREGRI